ILAGVYLPTAGTIRLGADVFPNGLTTADARAHGLAFVHQELGLLQPLSVAENIALVAGFRRSHGLISWRRQRGLAHDLLRTREAELVELIVGDTLQPHAPASPARRDDALLALQDVSGKGVEHVTLTLRRGEIVALVGLLGAGHRAVGRIVAGVELASAGEM